MWLPTNTNIIWLTGLGIFRSVALKRHHIHLFRSLGAKLYILSDACVGRAIPI